MRLVLGKTAPASVVLLGAVPAREPPPFATYDVRATRRPNNDNDDHAECRMRIVIEIITTNTVWCSSNTSSQGALRARYHRYDADGSQ